jgi:hypothetical protein
MKNIKRLAAGIITGAAITSAPLVAFAAPAFAATHAANPDPGAASHSRVLVNNAASAGSLRDGNAARCGGGINC